MSDKAYFIFIAAITAAMFAVLMLAGCTAAQKEQVIELIGRIPEPTPTPAPTPLPTPIPAPTPAGQIPVDRSGFVSTGDIAVDFGAWHGCEMFEGSIVVDGLTMDRLGYLQREWIRHHGAPVPLWSEDFGHYQFGGY
jgi:hypothetical protein